MLSWALRLAGIWGAVAVIGLLFINHWPGARPDGGRLTAAATTAVTAHPVPATPTNSLVYRADQYGHVNLDATVNGSSVRFLVDTGASMVVLTPDDAAAAGIDRNSLRYDRRVQTANGTTMVAPVTLREIRIDQLSVYDVPAVVSDNLNISLLGQSFLTRLESYEMRSGKLTLNW